MRTCSRRAYSLGMLASRGWGVEQGDEPQNERVRERATRTRRRRVAAGRGEAPPPPLSAPRPPCWWVRVALCVACPIPSFLLEPSHLVGLHRNHALHPSSRDRVAWWLYVRTVIPTTTARARTLWCGVATAARGGSTMCRKARKHRCPRDNSSSSSKKWSCLPVNRRR